MMKRLPLLLAALVSSALAPSFAPSGGATEGRQDAPAADPVVARIIQAGREESRVMEHLDHLCNKIGPRLSGSDNLTRACEWARDRFEEWGLKARIEEWGTWPVAFNRKGWSGRMLVPEKKELLFGFNSWTAGTAGRVAGHAVVAPATEEELAALKGRLKGAWVLSLGKATSRALADQITAAYAEEGIAGVIRSSGGDLILTAGQVPSSFEKIPKRPAITLQGRSHKEILAHLKEGREVRLEFDIRNEFKPGPVPLYNVIADIPGTEFPDEYVVVGGHIDSWDGATGTTDNGTGSATTLEAARLLMRAGAKPRRTIRFILWSAEEQGLHGSKGYVARHPDEMARISAVLVHDGGTNYVAGIGVTTAMAADARKVFAPVLDLDPALPFTITETLGLPRTGGSDHVSYRAAGVPGFFWKQEGRQLYEHEHHTQYDTYDSAVPEYQRHSSMVIAIGALGIANLDHLLSRDRMEEEVPEPARRRLGVQFSEGLVVEGAMEGSPAEAAGFREGDEILRIAGVAVKTPADLVKEIKKGGPSEVAIVVKRGGRELELTVTFPDRGVQRRQKLGFFLGGESGLEVLQLTEGQAAQKAGFQVGDEILKLGDKAVGSLAELWTAINDAPKKTTATVRRKGQEKILELSFDP